MKRIFLFLFALLCLSVYATEFRFNQAVGTKYRFKNFVRQSVYINGQLAANFEQMHKAVVEILSNDGVWAHCRGRFEYYLKNVDRNEPFRLKNVYHSRFMRDAFGRMIVPPNIVMPVVRGVPTFPDTNLTVGMRWNAPGEEAQELVQGRLYRVPIDVSYVYLGEETIQDNTYSVFLATYQIRYHPRGDRYVRSYTGTTSIRLYWDREKQGVRYYREEYSFMIVLVNGETQNFVGTSEGVVDFLQEEGVKTNLVMDLQRNLNTNGAMSIRQEVDGVIVNLGNVLFEFDRATIRREFEDGLNRLAEVLKKYPQLDVLVSGHTDSVGNPEYNQRLSELRAKAIAGYMLRRGINRGRIAYIGHGDTQPVASNATAQGRAQNRRVEIKIITRE